MVLLFFCCRAGSEFAEDTFIDKVKMEIVVSKDQVISSLLFCNVEI
jgi:hypothetical protein